MTNSSKKHKGQRGKKSPDSKGMLEKLANHKAEQEAFYKRCRKIFERVRPKLQGDHDHCFIVIEPKSKDYIIDADLDQASQKACQKHPGAMLLAFRLNDEGVCAAPSDFRSI